MKGDKVYMDILRKMKEYIYLLKEIRVYKSLFFHRGGDGILLKNGWMSSKQTNSIIDGKGNPIPWYTYSAISFLNEYDLSAEEVFEWGSGYSTFYYTDRVKSIRTVENNEKWYRKVKDKVAERKHVTCLFRNSEEEYVRAICENSENYSIIVVDGEYREMCGKEAVDHLKSEGVIILDDSERQEYSELKDYLLKKNFKSLNFWGIAAGISYLKCTSIYYRPNNIFNI